MNKLLKIAEIGKLVLRQQKHELAGRKVLIDNHIDKLSVRQCDKHRLRRGLTG